MKNLIVQNRGFPRHGSAFSLALGLFVALPAHCQDLEADTESQAQQDATKLAEIKVRGRRENLVGAAISASQGLVGPSELSARPRLRPGDIVENVPGMVATQHSGSGKANQYFLRGFNLDHGTDFAVFVEGMPVNMRTHGHGQGWTDLNFLIPEMIDELAYRKGPYYADVGDFSAAGSVAMRYAERLPENSAELSVGEFGYARAVSVGSAELAQGALSFGLETQTYEGPWTDIDEDVEKFNGVLKWSMPLGQGTGHLTAMGYDNTWNSADQIPARAVASRLIDSFGSLDNTVGGTSSRYSLSGGWRGPAWGGQLLASAYAISSDLELFSNFTYLLDDPLQGDQFRQLDERRVFGGALSDSWQGERWKLRSGLDYRYDDIDRVALTRTRARQVVSPVRDDVVAERSLGLYVDGELRLSEQLRAYAGLRQDFYRFAVQADNPLNSGKAKAEEFSPKASLVYTLSDPLELYLSYGQGFHSNDARGTTIVVDPLSGDPAARVDALAGSHGAELGARWFVSEKFHATAALWRLDIDSELIFVGDAGNTEAGRPSRRRGLDLALYWFASERFDGEVEVSYADAEFRDRDPAGSKVPGSIPLVISAGVNSRFERGWFATARVRHFGEYPLIEDDSVRSDGSTLLNLRLGKRWAQWTATLDLLNALDSEDHDVDYFYASRLPGEPAEGVEDLHFHVFEPRAVRLALAYRW